MPSIRPNAIRIKRFRELKENLRTKRDRLLVGVDIAKAQHVAQVRLAHTRTLEKRFNFPNTGAGFERLWAHLQTCRQETGVSEIVCAVEPTGTYHEALAQFLEAQGVDVVLVSNQVAHYNRRTLDGTWGKSDPKDAHNLCDLLERGMVLFYSRPDGPIAALRRLVRLLRQARVELGACKARFRNTLLPLLGPAGEPLPCALLASLPLPLRRLCPAAPEALRPRGRPRRPAPGRVALGPGAVLPPGLASELTALVARLAAVQARIAQIETALVQVAAPLPAAALLRTIPGVGPTLGAILLAELGDIAWDHEVLSTPEARGPGHRPSGIGPVGGHGADLPVREAPPPLGPGPGGPRGVPQSGVARASGGPDREAAGGSARLFQGDYGVGGEAPAPRLERLAEWAAL